MANRHCINCKNKLDVQKCVECNDDWNNFILIDPKGGVPNVVKKKVVKKQVKSQNKW